MLAVPHRADRRGFAAERGVQIGGLGREAGRALNEPHIGGEQKADRFLPNAASPRRFNIVRSGGFAIETCGFKETVQVNNEVAHMGVVDGPLPLPRQARSALS